MAVHEITHPLIAHKLGLMRNAKISSKDFRELASEVGNLLTYEATRTLPTERAVIKSWSGDEVEVKQIKGKKIRIFWGDIKKFNFMIKSNIKNQ